MEQWYLDNLVCPVDKTPLEYKDGKLISPSGRKYPVVEGVPNRRCPWLQHHWKALRTIQIL